MLLLPRDEGKVPWSRRGKQPMGRWPVFLLGTATSMKPVVVSLSLLIGGCAKPHASSEITVSFDARTISDPTVTLTPISNAQKIKLETSILKKAPGEFPYTEVLGILHQNSDSKPILLKEAYRGKVHGNVHGGLYFLFLSGVGDCDGRVVFVEKDKPLEIDLSKPHPPKRTE